VREGRREGGREEWKHGEGAEWGSCPYPCSPLLTTLSTSLVREIEHEMSHALVGGVSTIRPYLVLTVERANIVQSTLHALALYEPFEYKKKLKVRFRGEEGVDEGGVQKGASSGTTGHPGAGFCCGGQRNRKRKEGSRVGSQCAFMHAGYYVFTPLSFPPSLPPSLPPSYLPILRARQNSSKSSCASSWTLPTGCSSLRRSIKTPHLTLPF
jgi:hypothetical protein